MSRLRMLRWLAAAAVFSAVTFFAIAELAANEEPSSDPDAGYTGRHCQVTCGRFKEDTCEVWDPAGLPSCQCTVGQIGAFTECRCANGSTPTQCKCTNAPRASCDPHNPQDECGSCQCQC